MKPVVADSIMAETTPMTTPEPTTCEPHTYPPTKPCPQTCEPPLPTTEFCSSEPCDFCDPECGEYTCPVDIIKAKCVCKGYFDYSWDKSCTRYDWSCKKTVNRGEECFTTMFPPTFCPTKLPPTLCPTKFPPTQLPTTTVPPGTTEEPLMTTEVPMTVIPRTTLPPGTTLPMVTIEPIMTTEEPIATTEVTFAPQIKKKSN